MALESASYISQLVAANPPEADPAVQAADHLRLIKSALLATFPNLNAAVTTTPKQLSSDVVPVGGIIVWYSTLGSIPAGWGLCNGSTYAKLDGSGNITTPNLTDVFLRGAGNTYAPAATGGLASSTPTLSDPGTVLTQANLPSYNLTVTDPGHGHSITDPGHHHTISGWSQGGGTYLSGTVWNGGGGSFSTGTSTTGITVGSNGSNITVASGGSNTAHTHSITSSAVPTIPPYVALAYIMKL